LCILSSCTMVTVNSNPRTSKSTNFTFFNIFMTTFESLGLSPEILKAVKDLGFEQPMPVQEEVVPLLLEQTRDIVALAQTGTGKTAAFGLPLLQHIDQDDRRPQTLILSPTRELCLQIAKDLESFAKYLPEVRILAVYGGSSIETQIRALKKGVHIIVATPGRLVDLINRKAAILDSVSNVVLDEADEMLNMGFLDSINEILSAVPDDRNTLLFSATMPREIANIAKNYMTEPVEVTIGRKNEGNVNVTHVAYTVAARDKYLVLKRIADYNPNIYGIVFCRTRAETQEVANKLIHDGYNADALHGDLSQPQRDYVMQKFRVGHIQLLVATDVAARGLDVDNLTHIINYNLPDDVEVYTHRSGRTGRAGRTGISIAITNLREKNRLRQIEKILNREFEHAPVPTGKEICERQLLHLIDKMQQVDVNNSIEPFLPEIMTKLEDLSKEEIIKRFVSLEFNRFLDYYRNAKDIMGDEAGSRGERGRRERDDRYERGGREERGGRNERRRERSGDRRERSDDRRERSDDRRERSDRGGDRFERSTEAEQGFTRFFINVGKMDGITPGALIDLINKHTRGEKVPVGRIDLMRKFSFFEVESPYARTILSALDRVDHDGMRVSVEVADSGGNDSSPRKRDRDDRGDFKRRDDFPYDSSFSAKRKRNDRDDDFVRNDGPPANFGRDRNNDRPFFSDKKGGKKKHKKNK
jgi:ATP-dependent RNA helicase DeaD